MVAFFALMAGPHGWRIKMRAKGGRKPKNPVPVTLAGRGTAGKSPLPPIQCAPDAQQTDRVNNKPKVLPEVVTGDG
jgi:hypothetical protein